MSPEAARRWLDVAHEGFVVIGPDSRIIGWNAAAERTFGWSRSEAIGRDVADTIIPERYREAHRNGLRHFLESGEGPVLDQRLELEAVHRDGNELPVELTISAVRVGEGWQFGAFLRDISERRRASRYLEAQLALTRVLAESQTTDDMLARALSAIGAGLGWELGEYWAVDAAAGVMRRSTVWQTDGAQLEDFAAARRDVALGPGQGLVGRVWTSGEPVWSQEAAEELVLPRNRAAAGEGLRAAIALPVVAEGEVAGVVMFVSRRMERPDSRLLALLATLGAQIGHAQRALHETEQRLGDAFEDAPVAIAIVQPDMDGRLIEVNHAFCELLGSTAGELLGRSVRDLAHPADRAIGDSARRRLVEGSAERTDREQRLLRSDGTAVWTQLSLALARDHSGRPHYVIGHVLDITDRKRAEEQLAHRELHDPVTGLPNRALFLDRLDLARKGREAPSCAVLSIGLDRFRLVNETLGHSAGDEVLRVLGERVADTVRPTDTVSRVGGDHFAVICEGVEPAELGTIAARLRTALSAPLVVDDHELRPRASMGAVLTAGDDAETPADELLRRAETAMHDAKSRGGDRLDVFESPVGLTASARLTLERELREAIANGDIVAHYQPKFDLRSGRTRSIEALARWEHADRGLVPPGDFIPVAEESGLIIAVGAHVLRAACRTLRELSTEPGRGPPEVCVNLSPRQFDQSELPGLVARTLSETGLEPERLCLEVTESTVMAHADPTPILHGLKDLRVKLALDDFGVGSSSLERLRGFPPIDFIKIDRSFITPLEHDARSRAIVTAIINLAHALGSEVVAEGVETPGQLDVLRALGCDIAQGFLLARPQPWERLSDTLAPTGPGAAHA